MTFLIEIRIGDKSGGASLFKKNYWTQMQRYWVGLAGYGLMHNLIALRCTTLSLCQDPVPPVHHPSCVTRSRFRLLTFDNSERRVETLAGPTPMDQHNGNDQAAAPALSKNARKKLLKQQRLEARKAERKAAEKERKRQEAERRRREWEQKLAAAASEEERARLIESRREMRRERMEKRSEEREMKIGRLQRAAEVGQKVVVDLEFAHLMTPNEIHSLVQQVPF